MQLQKRQLLACDKYFILKIAVVHMCLVLVGGRSLHLYTTVLGFIPHGVE